MQHLSFYRLALLIFHYYFMLIFLFLSLILPKGNKVPPFSFHNYFHIQILYLWDN